MSQRLLLLSASLSIALMGCASGDPALGFDYSDADIVPPPSGARSAPGVMAMEQAAFGQRPAWAEGDTFSRASYGDTQEQITAQRIAEAQAMQADVSPQGSFFERHGLSGGAPIYSSAATAPRSQVIITPAPAQRLASAAQYVQPAAAPKVTRQTTRTVQRTQPARAPAVARLRAPAPARAVQTSSRASAMPSRQDIQRQPVQLSDAPTIRDEVFPQAGDASRYSVTGIPQMPAAVAGQCFALVKRPERYQTVREQVETRPAYQRIVATPAQYAAEPRQVVIREGYDRLEVVPTTFRNVQERVMTRPESVQYNESQPTFRTVTERVLVRPSRMVWIPGRGPIERLDNATGEIMCLVEEPAVYQTVTRQVADQAPATRAIRQPAEYRTVQRAVVDQPAQIRRVRVPAQTQTIQVARLVQPATTRQVMVPAEYGVVERRELVEPARLEWRPVLCQTNINRDTLRRLQSALANAGFDPGPIDGIVGKRTMAAVNAFQRSRGLPVDRYLNIETVRALGIQA